MRLVRIEKDELERYGIPFNRRTFYNWHYRGVHPELFVKIGRKLFIDYDKFLELVEASAQKSYQRAKKIKELREGV